MNSMEYVIGKYYRVPCAEVHSCLGNFLYTAPIIGLPHKDPQFGVNHFHYHVDGRFTDRNLYLNIDNEGKTNNIIYAEKSDYYNYAFKIVVRRRKCRRLTTGIKPSKGVVKYWKWYDTMVGKNCKGKKCPHLGTTMHEHGDKWICPLHNLIGNPITETIITVK